MTAPPSPDPEARIRIGELSRRTGVGADTLRAWERRYGLLEPVRTAGGFRMYGEADQRRVEAMQALLAEGLSAGEAARVALRGRAPAPGGGAAAPGASTPAGAPPTGVAAPSAAPGALAERLLAALTALDEEGSNAAFDEAVSALSLDAVVQDVIQVALREIGDRWSRGETTIGQEHFATNLLRGRLLGLARGWGVGAGPVAVLACPPGELHDLGLICFGLILRSRGWRVALLGADTPIHTVEQAAALKAADLVVIAAIDTEPFERSAAEISDLASRWPVVFGGAGARGELAAGMGARALPARPVEAALFVSDAVSS